MCAKIWAGKDWARLLQKSRAEWGSGVVECIEMQKPIIHHALVDTPSSQLGEVIIEIESQPFL
jgi:hypothetical protein